MYRSCASVALSRGHICTIRPLDCSANHSFVCRGTISAEAMQRVRRERSWCVPMDAARCTVAVKMTLVPTQPRARLSELQLMNEIRASADVRVSSSSRQRATHV